MRYIDRPLTNFFTVAVAECSKVEEDGRLAAGSDESDSESNPKKHSQTKAADETKPAVDSPTMQYIERPLSYFFSTGFDCGGIKNRRLSAGTDESDCEPNAKSSKKQKTSVRRTAGTAASSTYAGVCDRINSGTFTVFVDGTYKDGFAGCAAFFGDRHPLNCSKKFRVESPVEAEIKAVTMALQQLAKTSHLQTNHIDVCIDSLSVVDRMTGRSDIIKYKREYDNIQKLASTFARGVTFRYEPRNATYQGKMADGMARAALFGKEMNKPEGILSKKGNSKKSLKRKSKSDSSAKRVSWTESVTKNNPEPKPRKTSSNHSLKAVKPAEGLFESMRRKMKPTEKRKKEPITEQSLRRDTSLLASFKSFKSAKSKKSPSKSSKSPKSSGATKSRSLESINNSFKSSKVGKSAKDSKSTCYRVAKSAETCWRCSKACRLADSDEVHRCERAKNPEPKTIECIPNGSGSGSGEKSAKNSKRNKKKREFSSMWYYGTPNAKPRARAPKCNSRKDNKSKYSGVVNSKKSQKSSKSHKNGKSRKVVRAATPFHEHVCSERCHKHSGVYKYPGPNSAIGSSSASPLVTSSGSGTPSPMSRSTNCGVNTPVHSPATAELLYSGAARKAVDDIIRTREGGVHNETVYAGNRSQISAALDAGRGSETSGHRRVDGGGGHGAGHSEGGSGHGSAEGQK